MPIAWEPLQQDKPQQTDTRRVDRETLRGAFMVRFVLLLAVCAAAVLAGLAFADSAAGVVYRHTCKVSAASLDEPVTACRAIL